MKVVLLIFVAIFYATIAYDLIFKGLAKSFGWNKVIAVTISLIILGVIYNQNSSNCYPLNNSGLYFCKK